MPLGYVKHQRFVPIEPHVPDVHRCKCAGWAFDGIVATRDHPQITVAVWQRYRWDIGV